MKTDSNSCNEVRELLGRHAPTDAGETESLRRIVDLLAAEADPFSRHSFKPGHLTASAIVVDADLQNTLLIFHHKLKLWLQPGGHFEIGEFDPAAAAAREVLEETGLSTFCPHVAPLLLDVDIHGIPACKNEPEHFHFDLRMLLVAQSGDFRAGDGVDQCRWVSPNDFEIMQLDPGLARALKKVHWKSGH